MAIAMHKYIVGCTQAHLKLRPLQFDFLVPVLIRYTGKQKFPLYIICFELLENRTLHYIQYAARY